MNGLKFSLATLANIVSGFVLLTIVLTVVTFAYLAYFTNFDSEFVERAEAVRVLGLQVANNAPEAATGGAESFQRMERARSEAQRNVDVLWDGNPETGLPPTADYDASAGRALDNMLGPWNEIRADVALMGERRESVNEARQARETLGAVLPEVQSGLDRAAERLSEAGAQQRQVYWASQAALQAERVGRYSGEVATAGTEDNVAADRLAASVRELRRTLDSLLGRGGIDVPAVTEGNAVALLRQADSRLAGVEEDLATLVELAPVLSESLNAADRILLSADRLEPAAGALIASYRGLADNRLLPWWSGFALGALALVLLLLRIFMGRLISRQELAATEAERRRSEELSKQNQQAILDLLDEIQGLSEGDLTVQASVGEEFTGAIGDAFNDSIDALRTLVTTINETSVQVSSAAQETQATAMHLAEASDHQAHQITAASAAINEMAASIEQVSQNAEESAEVAQRSVDLATRGGDTVRRTIQGMDSIREQIQETSKRIKRLGESSQEIGNIVELINDIADQTNILALNASIQAAMAGEAGRGFAVVADEVQRLAERSGNATKQIEALVKTIQTDTNEAVISMEESTSGVVSGARLAEDAGEALREIESTSQQLAGLIQTISEAARQQAEAAANISDTMNVIQEITSQTSAGTNETATSIGNLADLANDLRSSVSGFKLPE